MVALLDNSPLPSKTALRARGATLPRNAPGKSCLNSSNRTEFRHFTYDDRRRLEYCSKDPIIYRGSKWNLFEYVSGRSCTFRDPLGLAIDKKAACEAAVKTFETNNTAKFRDKCPGWNLPKVTCEACGRGGSTSCSSSSQIVVKVCYGKLPNDKAGANNELKLILKHEFVHVLDTCKCGEGCKIWQDTLFESTEDHCDDLACLEIRAYSLDGGSDHLKGDERRDDVIRRAIGSMDSHKEACGDSKARIERMMDSCYIDETKIGDPSDFPR